MEEAPEKSPGVLDRSESSRELRTVLERLELSLAIRVVVGGMRTRMRLGDPELAEQLPDSLRSHGRPPIGMNREFLRLDSLALGSLLDQFRSQRRALPVREQPAHNAAAVDVEHDVELIVVPLLGPTKLGDIPRPNLIGSRGEEFWLRVLRMRELIPPFPSFSCVFEDSVHGANRAEVAIFVQERGVDRSWRLIDEAFRVQLLEYRLPL